MSGCLIKRKKLDTDGYRGKIKGRHREEIVIYSPRRKTSEETNPADTLIPDFWPPEL